MRYFLAATLLSALAASALAAPPDAPNRTFQGRDLFALQLATDPQIRPDGREIAYVRVSFDIMTDRGAAIDLARRRRKRGEQRRWSPRRLAQPRWSPTRGPHRIRLGCRRRPSAIVRALAAERPDREDHGSHRSAGKPRRGRPTASGSRSRCSRPTRRREARRSAAEAGRRGLGAAARADHEHDLSQRRRRVISSPATHIYMSFRPTAARRGN